MTDWTKVDKPSAGTGTDSGWGSSAWGSSGWGSTGSLWTKNSDATTSWSKQSNVSSSWTKQTKAS